MVVAKKVKKVVVDDVAVVEEKVQTSLTSPKELLQQMSIVDNIIRDVKKTLDAFYKDEKVSLETKRQVYLKTPQSLEKNEYYMIHLPALESAYKAETGRRFNWSDTFYMDRHEILNLKEICLDLLEYRGSGDYCVNWSPGLIETFVNEIASSGVHSFNFDW